MKFTHLKIRIRIYAGFGSLIVLGLVVAAVGSWGIDGLDRQTVRMNALAGNFKSVAAAVRSEEVIALILLHAAGNHDVVVSGAEGRDEIGDMARAVNIFKANIIQAEPLATEQETARSARARRQDAMDGHTQMFGKSVTGVMWLSAPRPATCARLPR